MPKFVKKPVEIEAIQFTGDNYKEIREFTKANSVTVWDGQIVTHLLINTLEGPMKALPGDWIIRGIKGEYYPCKPDIFASTYTPYPAPESKEEALDFVESVYNETGVTPELRRVYDFYKKTQNDPQPSKAVAVAEALAEKGSKLIANLQEGEFISATREQEWLEALAALRTLKGEQK